MASSFSSFSSLRFPSPLHNPNPNNSLLLLPPRTPTLSFIVNSLPPRKLQNSVTPPPPSSDEKSLAVATGEIFLGLASRLINLRSSNTVGGDSSSVTLFESSTKKGAFHEDRIEAVIEDEVEPEVVWEQRVEDAEAERERRVVTSPGFSFSAAGLLFPYHLGVANFLIEKGYIKETTPLAGSSAGAIVCAVVASGASMEEALKATKILAEDCRSQGTAFRLGAVLRNVLENFLPDDIHIRSNGRIRGKTAILEVPIVFFNRRICNEISDAESFICLMNLQMMAFTVSYFIASSVAVAVTQLFWRPRGLLVDQFESKEDLINAVFTSSFIPGYLAPRPATLFRNRLCIDGGLTLFMPSTSATQTVRVCAFPASRLGLKRIGISPDCNPENRAGPRQLFNWALEPADDEILDHLFEVGYMDAAVWALENPIEKILQDNVLVALNETAQ